MSVAQETTASQRLLALCKEYTENVGKVKEEAERLAKQWIAAQPFGGVDSAKEPARKPKPILRGQATQQPLSEPDKLKLFAETRLDALASGYHWLENGVQELVRAVSQRLEHSEIDFEDRLELKVRLADLRGKLKQTEILLGALHFLVN
jgi:hypothetical protein